MGGIFSVEAVSPKLLIDLEPAKAAGRRLGHDMDYASIPTFSSTGRRGKVLQQSLATPGSGEEFPEGWS